MVKPRGGEPKQKINLPITPMLDMTFQLLFFFIMNFHPADLEGQMDVSLPSEEHICHPPEGLPARPERPPEFPSDLTVIVRAHGGGGPEGGIANLWIRTIEGRS